MPQIPQNLFGPSAQIGQLFGIFLKRVLFTCPFSIGGGQYDLYLRSFILLCSHRISFGIFDDFHLLTAALFLSYCQPQWDDVLSNGAFILNSTVTLDKLNSFFQLIFIETLNKWKTPNYPSELKKYSHKLIIPLKIQFYLNFRIKLMNILFLKLI